VQLVVCDSPAGRLGLTVCYDLRFPEVFQSLTWSMGAKVLLVPSAFTKVTGKDCLSPWQSIAANVQLELCWEQQM
jgi:predicted amidohydrolase